MTRTSLFVTALTLSVLAAVVIGYKTFASLPGMEGTIVAVDATDQRIQVLDDESEYWFRCTPHTTITLNGYAATFNQLTAGQRAKVDFDSRSFEALRVDAMPR